MPADGKKDVKAVLKVLPWSEMKKPQKAWFQENFGKNRNVKEWTYEKKAKLDPREWDANKLQKALTALTRYEAVLFAGRCEEWMRTIDKSKDKDKSLKDAQKKLPLYFKDIYKQMTLKVDKAIDELSKDSGESKKSIEAGEAIFEKAEELAPKEIFKDTADEVVHALAVYEKAIGKAKDDNDKEAALSTAAASVRSIEGSFKAVYKSKTGVVKDINTKAAKMAKDSKADATMQKTGKSLTRLKSDTTRMLGEMMAFQNDIKNLAQEFFNEDMDDRKLKNWTTHFKAAEKSCTVTNNLQDKFAGLNKTFADQAKKLQKK